MMEGKGGVAAQGGHAGRRTGSPRFAPRAPQWPVAAPGSAASLLGSLAAVARRLAGPLPLEHLAAIVSDAASNTLDAPVLVIAVIDDIGRRLRPLHARGLREDAELFTILNEAWTLLDRTGRPGAISPAPGIRTLAALPVPPVGRRLGVMLAGSAADRRFTRDEQAYLTALTGLLGLALQRRRRDQAAGSHLRVGDLEIDLGEQRVTVGDRHARLTPSETRLLLFLAEDPGRPRTRREILQHIWRTEHVADERACDAHISNLRRKIERTPSRPERLVTVRSVGYALKPVSAM
jgi:DNA-binding winged helix-turn-helix (wHTH) protein